MIRHSDVVLDADSLPIFKISACNGETEASSASIRLKVDEDIV